MKVLVLGGTGAMGSHLARALSVAGIETVVTSRTQRDSEGRLRYIRGDAHDLQFLQEILKGRWDAIVDFMVYATPDFEHRAPLFLNATAQYVFLSSARVYANSESRLTEASPRLLDVGVDKAYLATDEYALAKARQEDVLRRSGRRTWSIVRPYITYGEDRLQLGILEKENWLYRALQGRTIVFSRDIAMRRTTLTYGEDVSRGVQAILGRPEAFGEAFHITAPDQILWGEALQVYLNVLEEHLGHRPSVSFLDLERFEACHAAARYQIRHDRLYDRAFDNQKIAQYIAVDRFKKAEVGLRQCLEAFLKHSKFRPINWRAEGFRDRAVRERAALSEIPGARAKFRYLRARYSRAQANL